MTSLLLFAPSAIALLWFVIYIIAFVAIVGLLFWAVNRLCAAFGISEPIRSVIIVGLVVLCVAVFVIYFLQGGLPR